jgi:hypothetical protein
MAIGARILSNNLSGKTATVTFTPVTGSTSGTTQNLGTKTIPFNNITSHPYGYYNINVTDYDYTYTLDIPEPVNNTQLFVYVDRMVASDNYGAATLNFNDFTAEVIDLNVDSTYWENRDVYFSTESGYMYYFRGDANSDERLVIFTDSSNVEIERYSGATGNFSRGILDGVWTYAEFGELGVLKYSNGTSVYTYNWDPLTHYIDIENDWSAETSDGTFIIKKYELGVWNYDGNGESYIVNPDNGTTTLFKTWTDGTYVRHRMNKSSNFIVVETQNQDNTTGNTYTNLEICSSTGTVLETVSLTGATYDNYYAQFHGTNKYTTVYYNNNDWEVDYKIIHYNGNTDTLVQTSHVRGESYQNLNVNGNDDYWPSSDNLNNGAILISFYNQIGWDSVGTVTTFCDFVYMLDNQTSFSTYVFANDTNKSFAPWGIQLSDIIRIVCDNGDDVLSVLTIMSGTFRVESMNALMSDVSQVSYRWLGNKALIQIFTNNGNNVTYKYINSVGVVTDEITSALNNTYGANMTNSGEVAYMTIQRAAGDGGNVGYYVDGNTPDIASTTYYSSTYTMDNFDSQTKELPDVVFLFAGGSGEFGRVLSSTGITDELNFPAMTYFDVRMGKDKFMILYQDSNDNNYIKFNLYDYTGTLLNNQSTTYTSWSDSWGVKDRFVVKINDNSNNTVIHYLISEETITSVTTESYDDEYTINDYIWWD